MGVVVGEVVGVVVVVGVVSALEGTRPALDCEASVVGEVSDVSEVLDDAAVDCPEDEALSVVRVVVSDLTCGACALKGAGRLRLPQLGKYNNDATSITTTGVTVVVLSKPVPNLIWRQRLPDSSRNIMSTFYNINRLLSIMLIEQ